MSIGPYLKKNIDAKAISRLAEVVEDVPSKIEKDDFTGKRFELGNYKVVRDESGEEHHLINGSINQTSARVGTKGKVVYRTGPTYGLWFFEPDSPTKV